MARVVARAHARARDVEEPRAVRRLGETARHARAQVRRRLPFAEAETADDRLRRIRLQRHLPAAPRHAVSVRHVVAALPHLKRPVRTHRVDLVEHRGLHRVGVDVILGLEHAGNLRHGAHLLGRHPHAEVASRDGAEEEIAEPDPPQLARDLGLVRAGGPIPDVRRALQEIQSVGEARVAPRLLGERHAVAATFHLGAVAGREASGRGRVEEHVANAPRITETPLLRRPFRTCGAQTARAEREGDPGVRRRLEDRQHPRALAERPVRRDRLCILRPAPHLHVARVHLETVQLVRTEIREVGGQGEPAAVRQDETVALLGAERAGKRDRTRLRVFRRMVDLDHQLRAVQAPAHGAVRQFGARQRPPRAPRAHVRHGERPLCGIVRRAQALIRGGLRFGGASSSGENEERKRPHQRTPMTLCIWMESDHGGIASGMVFLSFMSRFSARR